MSEDRMHPAGSLRRARLVDIAATIVLAVAATVLSIVVLASGWAQHHVTAACTILRYRAAHGEHSGVGGDPCALGAPDILTATIGLGILLVLMAVASPFALTTVGKWVVRGLAVVALIVCLGELLVSPASAS